MKMFKKKAMTSLAAVVAASIFVAAGCSNDDDPTGDGDGDGDGDGTGGIAGDGDGDGDATGGIAGDGDGDGDGFGTCDALCDGAAAEDCGSKSDCMAECEYLADVCTAELESYLDCGASQTLLVCVDGYSIGGIPACALEGGAVLACSEAIGAGGGGAGGGGGATP